MKWGWNSGAGGDARLILVQRDAFLVEIARPLEAARFQLQHVVAAVPVFIDPFADRIAVEGSLELANFVRPDFWIVRGVSGIVPALEPTSRVCK